MEYKDEFRQSYRFFEKEEPGGNQEGSSTVIWQLIDIQDWETFKTKFGYMLFLNTYFNDYWNVRELMFLVNNLVTDDKDYIDLSTKLTELEAEINHAQTLIGNKADDIWEIKSESELINNKRDRELIRMVVKSMENIQEIAQEVVEIINQILE